MPRGIIKSIEGRKIVLSGPDKGEETVTCKDKLMPVTINGEGGKRISDLKNGDQVVITLTGDSPSNIVATRDGTEPVKDERHIVASPHLSRMVK